MDTDRGLLFTVRRMFWLVALAGALVGLTGRLAYGQGQVTGIIPLVSQGSVTASDAGTCFVTGPACVVILPGGYSSLGVQVAGTWTGTLQFESCLAFCSTASNWVSVTMSPPGVFTPVTNVSANGQWQAVAPAVSFRVRASTLSSGSATVTVFATLSPGQPTIFSASGCTPAGTTGDIPFRSSTGTCDADSGIFHYTKASHLLFVNNVSSNALSPLLLETQPQAVNLTADPIHIFTGATTCGGCASAVRGGEIDIVSGTADSTNGGSGNVIINSGGFGLGATNFPGSITLQNGEAATRHNGADIDLFAGLAGAGATLGGGTGGKIVSRAGQGGAIGTGGSPTAGPGGDYFIEPGAPGTGGGTQAIPGTLHFAMLNSSLGLVTDCQGTDTTLSGTFSWSSACGFTTHTAGALTANELVVGNGSSDLKVTPCLDGQVPIGSTADNTVSCTTLTAGPNITITNAAHGITIQAAGAGASPTQVIGITIDGAGAVITTGLKGFYYAPAACTINTAVLMSTDNSVTSGSIVIDVWKAAFASYPPTVANTITASDKPTLSSATNSKDTTLTGWTKSVGAGDVLGFHVDSVSNLTRVTLQLLCQ